MLLWSGGKGPLVNQKTNLRDSIEWKCSNYLFSRFLSLAFVMRTTVVFLLGVLCGLLLTCVSFYSKAPANDIFPSFDEMVDLFDDLADSILEKKPGLADEALPGIAIMRECERINPNLVDDVLFQRVARTVFMRNVARRKLSQQQASQTEKKQKRSQTQDVIEWKRM